jgi:hypothetical protein
VGILSHDDIGWHKPNYYKIWKMKSLLKIKL